MSLGRYLSGTIKNQNILLYADKSILVINKPSGLVCQGGQTQDRSRSDLESLLDGLQARVALPAKPVQVHRLDKLATGAFVFGRTAVAGKELANQFQSRTVQKTYLALVRGGRKSFPDVGRGSINDGLVVGRDHVHVDAVEGRVALTDWELLGTSDMAPLSLLRLTLHSGIKHQLRVHLAHVLRTPILGDAVYSQKPPSAEIAALIPRNVQIGPRMQQQRDRKELEPSNAKMFLHSSRISIFRYRSAGPHKRFRLGITAPLPPEFVAVCDAAGLRQYLTEQDIRGGVDVDGAPLPSDSAVEGVDGRWMAS